MADTVQTTTLITLAQEYRGDVVRQINRRVALLKLLKIVPSGGQNIAWAPEADGQNAENYSEGADAANFTSDAQASAVLVWGHYRSNFHVSDTAMDVAGSAQTPLGNRMLWARNLQNASAKLASKIEQELFAGLGTGTLISGLDLAIAQTTNTYATIDRSQAGNAYFRPAVVADPGVNTAISFQQIRDDIRNVFEQGGENPDIAVCSPAVFNQVAGLFDGSRRWTVVNTARGKVELDAGYEGLEVDGCMFVKAKDCQANRIYYLNSNHVIVEYLPPADRPPEVAEGEIEADDGYGQVPLGMRYTMLAKNGDSDRAMVTAKLNLKVERPNTCATRLHVAA